MHSTANAGHSTKRKIFPNAKMSEGPKPVYVDLFRQVVYGGKSALCLVHAGEWCSGLPGHAICDACKCLSIDCGNIYLRGINQYGNPRQGRICKGCHAWFCGLDPPQWWADAKQGGVIGGFSAQVLKKHLIDQKDKVYATIDSWYVRMYKDQAHVAVENSNIYQRITKAIQLSCVRLGPRSWDKAVNCSDCGITLTLDQKYGCFCRANRTIFRSHVNFERFMDRDSEWPIQSDGTLSIGGSYGEVKWLCDTCLRIHLDRMPEPSIFDQMRSWLRRL